MENDLSALAAEGYRALTWKSRGNKEIVVRMDDAPEWLDEIVRSAHAGIMPDDWTYEVIKEAFSDISDENTDSHEFGDSADIYNSDLLDWTRDFPGAAGYIDEAREELGDARDFYHSIQMGQYLARRMIFDRVLEGLQDVLDEIESNIKDEDEA